MHVSLPVIKNSSYTRHPPPGRDSGTLAGTPHGPKNLKTFHTWNFAPGTRWQPRRQGGILRPSPVEATWGLCGLPSLPTPPRLSSHGTASPLSTSSRCSCPPPQKLGRVTRYSNMSFCKRSSSTRVTQQQNWLLPNSEESKTLHLFFFLPPICCRKSVLPRPPPVVNAFCEALLSDVMFKPPKVTRTRLSSDLKVSTISPNCSTLQGPKNFLRIVVFFLTRRKEDFRRVILSPSIAHHCNTRPSIAHHKCIARKVFRPRQLFTRSKLVSLLLIDKGRG